MRENDTHRLSRRMTQVRVTSDVRGLAIVSFRKTCLADAHAWLETLRAVTSSVEALCVVVVQVKVAVDGE